MKTQLYAAAFGLALTIGVAPRSVGAQVVYSNGAPNSQAGWDIFNDYRAADDFGVASLLQFDQIRFWGLLPSLGTYAPSIFWQILSDAGGVPGPTVVVGGSAVATPTLRTSLPFGFDSWQFDLDVGPQLLGPGIFWLALHDGAPGDITDSTLLWEMTSGQSGSEFAINFIPADEWTGNSGGDLAFELRDSSPVTATPEPTTIVLVVTGFAGIAMWKRRRRAVHGTDVCRA